MNSHLALFGKCPVATLLIVAATVGADRPATTRGQLPPAKSRSAAKGTLAVKWCEFREHFRVTNVRPADRKVYSGFGKGYRTQVLQFDVEALADSYALDFEATVYVVMDELNTPCAVPIFGNMRFEPAPDIWRRGQKGRAAVEIPELPRGWRVRRIILHPEPLAIDPTSASYEWMIDPGYDPYADDHFEPVNPAPPATRT